MILQHPQLNVKYLIQIWLGTVYILLVALLTIAIERMYLLKICLDFLLFLLYCVFSFVWTPAFLKNMSWNITAKKITVNTGVLIRKKRVFRRSSEVSWVRFSSPLMRLLNVSAVIFSGYRGFIFLFAKEGEDERI